LQSFHYRPGSHAQQQQQKQQQQKQQQEEWTRRQQELDIHDKIWREEISLDNQKRKN
jgi:hypothetical protein